ncbi:MAG: VRR-NUC domain-containing protein [Anaerolineae bacterium]
MIANQIDRLPPESEKEFLQMVIDLAHLNGWLCYHTFDSRRSAAGFPDLVAVRGETQEILFIEVKREKGRLSREQRMWLEALSRALPGCAFVIRPSRWDQVEALLARETS